jgi:SAM-dependent methyltransferase
VVIGLKFMPTLSTLRSSLPTFQHSLQELNFPPNSFTHVYMSFGIMFPSNTLKVLSNMYDALVPGAPVSFTFWKRFGIWSLMHKASILATSDPTLPPPKFYHPHWNHPETMVSFLEHAGFKDVRVSEQEIPWTAESKTAFVNNAMATPLWSEYVRKWSEEQREKVRDCALEVLDEEFPDAGHGPIEIPMEAYIAFARKPEETDV